MEQRNKSERENISLQAKWDVKKEEIQQRKEQFLSKKLKIKELVSKALPSMIVVDVQRKEWVPQPVEQLEGVIQKLQQHITDLELHTVPETPQEIKDQREITAHKAVDRMIALDLECKKLSSHNTQTYENLTENPELYKLESHLQEAKYEAEKIQTQLKALSPIERMKRSHE
jgi:hypothetical protein